MIHTWRPWKLSNFQDPPLPLSIYVQNSSNPLTLDVQFQTNTPSLDDNHQLKENKILGWLLYAIRSAFVFSINSLILSGFPLTCFHSAEVLLSAFSWLYTPSWLYAVDQKHHEMSFITIHFFSTYFSINMFFYWTTWKRKQTMEEQMHRVCERTNKIKPETKPGHVTLKLTTRCSI